MVKTFQRPDLTLGYRLGLRPLATVVARLATAGLVGGHENLKPQALNQPDTGKADVWTQAVNQAGDVERNCLPVWL